MWKDIKKEKPTDDGHYLVYYGGEQFIHQYSMGRWIQQWRINCASKDRTDDVEYWQPLQENPK